MNKSIVDLSYDQATAAVVIALPVASFIHNFVGLQFKFWGEDCGNRAASRGA